MNLAQDGWVFAVVGETSEEGLQQLSREGDGRHPELEREHGQRAHSISRVGRHAIAASHEHSRPPAKCLVCSRAHNRTWRR